MTLIATLFIILGGPLTRWPVASSDTPLQVKTGSMVNLFYKIREDSSKHRIKVSTIIHGEILVLHRLLLPARLHSINAGVVYYIYGTDSIDNTL